MRSRTLPAEQPTRVALNGPRLALRTGGAAETMADAAVAAAGTAKGLGLRNRRLHCPFQRTSALEAKQLDPNMLRRHENIVTAQICNYVSA